MSLKNTRRGLSRHDVRLRLRELAFQRGPSAKMPTQSELCAQIGTTTSTLDEALRDLEAANVIYRRQGSGIFVSPKLHMKSIVVLYDTSVADQPGISPFWGMLWGALVKEAQKRAQTHDQEFTFRMTTSALHPESLLPPDVMRSLGEGLVQGVVGIGLASDEVAVAAARGIPLVSFAGAGQYHVEFDLQLEVRAGVDALLARGCRTIGFWHGTLPYGHNKEYDDGTFDAFVDQLQVRGVPFYPDLVRDYRDVPEGQFRGTQQQQGYRLVMETFGLEPRPRPDGLLMNDDMLTSGALFAFKELNLEMEKTVQVATIANAGSTVLFGHEKSLILIEHDPREVAAAILHALDKLMDGHSLKAEEHLVLPKIRLPEDYPGVLQGL
jgi:DNA-binding LacI/PurR family transcriptional regulator